ncbi:MAG TPA: hypothetical protein PLJ18_11795 [Niabella sp.]|nr:hypothetical protein [Bacteroidia bacterium]HOZ91038.1 hypothetical protein [Bacteroidia bacterium]HRB52060.1 hypothetical protein [Bacteroidia bacterium]HRC03128.1 hypothetical protein [Niabella sp.]
MHLTTVQGYGFFECSSAFQKSIRRGDETNALYFAVELFNSGYDEYVWKRMKVITSEDIGLAEPNAPAIIQSLYEMYNDAKAKKHEKMPQRLHYVHAIMYLCRCKKSRLIDWTMIALWREHKLEKREVPDFAFDMHNAKGKQKGRGIDHFYNDGTELTNHVPQDGEEEWKQKAWKLHKEHPLPDLPVKKEKGKKNDLFDNQNSEV